eukprot:9468899-Pyramimonas_sp.AAC.2
MPAQPALVQLRRERRQPLVDGGRRQRDHVAVVDVRRHGHPATMHLRSAGLVEDPRISSQTHSVHRVNKDLMAHPERPAPAHRQRRKAGPDELVLPDRDAAALVLVVDRVDPELARGDLHVEAHPRPPGRVTELVETILQVH